MADYDDWSDDALTPVSQRTHIEMLREAYETAYRKGYQQGFEQAARHVQTMKNGGIVRVQEVANVLEAHALGPLVEWRGVTETGRGPFNRERPPALTPPNWWSIKRQVYRRDGRRCQVCDTKTGPFEVDHIKPVWEGGLPELGNLRVTCRACNRSRGRR